MLFRSYFSDPANDLVATASAIDTGSEPAEDAILIGEYIYYLQASSSPFIKITEGVADIPTAFIAEYGAGYPTVAIFGEFDALPGVSQSSSPYRENGSNEDAGHACGHHLFGAGSAWSAVAVKDWMKNNKINGTIRFYGTPAEEGGSEIGRAHV